MAKQLRRVYNNTQTNGMKQHYTDDVLLMSQYSKRTVHQANDHLNVINVI